MPKNKHGYDMAKWNTAKAEAKKHLIGVARNKKLTTYKVLYDGLAKKRSAISFPFRHRDGAFHELLGEISMEEHKAGRGMLSAIVVCKAEGVPGWGFFELAVELKLRKSYRNGKEEMELWVSQVCKVWC